MQLVSNSDRSCPVRQGAYVPTIFRCERNLVKQGDYTVTIFAFPSTRPHSRANGLTAQRPLHRLVQTGGPAISIKFFHALWTLHIKGSITLTS